MSWLKRKPQVRLLFRPMADITALELAECLSLVLAERDGHIDEVIDKAKPEVIRHWKKVKR